MTLLLGHVDECLLDSLRCSLAADGFNIAGLVGDVLDVDVDQDQADLLELGLEVLLDAAQERVAIAVNLFNAHACDDLTQLTEDDVLGLLHDLACGETEQAHGGVVHLFGGGADSDGEDTGHGHANVLQREGALEGRLDLHRVQGQVVVVLDQRPDKRTATVDGLGRATTGCLTVDDQDAVRGAALVAPREDHDRSENDQYAEEDGEGDRVVHAEESFC